MNLLALTGVTAVRGGRQVFSDIELALPPGGACIVSGPNGVGKTTVLRIAAGLLVPAAGQVERTGEVAWFGEAAALDEERPLAAALALWARIDGAAEAARRVEDALAAMGLADLADVPVRFLSTGQRRRGALARVIASAAPLWLLDEPASGLDAAAQDRLVKAIATHRARGGAVMAATHQPLALPDATELRLA